MKPTDNEMGLFSTAKTKNNPGLNAIGGTAEAEMHTPSTIDNEGKGEGLVSTVLRIVNWMPPRCRYDPKNPPEFTLAMNILLGFVCLCAIYFEFNADQKLGMYIHRRESILSATCEYIALI
jgi:hypothetical protein